MTWKGWLGLALLAIFILKDPVNAGHLVAKGIDMIGTALAGLGKFVAAI